MIFFEPRVRHEVVVRVRTGAGCTAYSTPGLSAMSGTSPLSPVMLTVLGACPIEKFRPQPHCEQVQQKLPIEQPGHYEANSRSDAASAWNSSYLSSGTPLADLAPNFASSSIAAGF